MAKLLKAWKMIFGSRFCPHYQKYKISPQKDIDIWSKSFPCQPRTGLQQEKYKTFFLEKKTLALKTSIAVGKVNESLGYLLWRRKSQIIFW